jgi:SMI1-KNR4 cell-wall
VTDVDLLHGGVFESRGRPASEELIRALEAGLSVELPEAYRAFLAEGDGARFREYNEIEGTWHGGLCVMFSVVDREASDRQLEQVASVYRDRVPSEFLAIGDDSAGNLVCLGVVGEHRGEVFFWDHEMEADEGEPPTMDNMERLAGSLNELLDQVKLI